MSSFTCALIEDSPIQAKVMSQMIMQAGWSIVSASTLKVGLQIIESQGVDLVISDLMLPDSMDGNTIALIREKAPNATIAAISAGAGKTSASDLLSRARAHGAEFMLQKPFTAERLKSMLEEVETRRKTGARRPHVLVVDDSRTMRAICATALREYGFRSTLVESMDEAFAGLDILDLDAIVTDVFMPGRDVIGSLRELRERLPGVALIAMSGTDSGTASDRALRATLEAGADVALPKPFKPAELAMAIRKGTVLAAAALLEAVKISA